MQTTEWNKMSIIGNIAGVPLFTTVQEALAWASANGLSGYHIHNLNGQQGYMGGINHQQASGMPLNTNAPTNNSSGSSGGGGGY